jgi:hypothetical protein
MSKKQSRRTVSLPGPLHWALRAHCKATKQTMAGLVTRIVRDYLKLVGAPTEAPRPPSTELHCGGEPCGGQHKGGYFTW